MNNTLRKQIQDYEDKLSRFEENHAKTIKNTRNQANDHIKMLKDMHYKQITDKDSHLNCVIEDKEVLKKEKEDLRRQIDNLNRKIKEHEKLETEFKIKFDLQKVKTDEAHGQINELNKQKKNQDQLIAEVKSNINEMRTQREGLQTEINMLKSKNEKYKMDNDNLKSMVKTKDGEIMTLNNSLVEKNRVSKEMENDLSINMSNKD